MALPLWDCPAFTVPYKALKDYGDLFSGKRSGHLTEYVYFGDVDYYERLVREEKNYYPTSEEISIIEECKHEIASIIGEDCNVVELGPGPGYILETKTIPLLKEFEKLSSYSAIDVNEWYAISSANIVRNALENVHCCAYVGDAKENISKRHYGKTALLFLGSTFSNFNDFEMEQIFSSFYNVLSEGDHLLISVDCNRDIQSIRRAYNNKYLEALTCNVMDYFKNSFLIKNFDPTKFKFEYEWNAAYRSVHLNLISTEKQEFYFNNNKVVIPASKKHHLVISRKFTEEFMKQIFRKHNFLIKKSFTSFEKSIILYLLKR
jgi:uncharacterized SAM-dependent methyltransferase